MTAHEIFTERHKEKVQRCKNQLVETGKTWAGLLATMVLTLSFSIPNGNEKEPGNFDFKILSHAYMFGFGCAATALVLFLSLSFGAYKECDFWQTIPLQFYFAYLSFALAVGAFLLTAVYSIILQIYGNKMNMKQLIPLILELVVFPVTCFVVLLQHGAKFGPK